MPKAGWCAECRDYVWVGADGGCSHGHGRPSLRGLYEAATPAGLLPLLPPRPDGTPGRLHAVSRLPTPLGRTSIPTTEASAVCRELGHEWGAPMPGDAHDRQCLRCGAWTGWKF